MHCYVRLKNGDEITYVIHGKASVDARQHYLALVSSEVVIAWFSMDEVVSVVLAEGKETPGASDISVSIPEPLIPAPAPLPEPVAPQPPQEVLETLGGEGDPRPGPRPQKPLQRPTHPLHKPGWKTSEFWISALVMGGTIGQGLLGYIPEKLAVPVSAGVGSAYLLSRTLVKRKTGEALTAEEAQEVLANLPKLTPKK